MALPSQTYVFDDFTLSTEEKKLSRNGEDIFLTHKSFQVLLLLIENAGKTIEKQEFFDKIWAESFVEENNLTVAMTGIRKALGETSKSEHYIKTVPRRGYVFTGEVKELSQNQPVNAAPNKSNAKRNRIFAVAAMLLIPLIIGGYYLLSSRQNQAETKQYRLAVLPLTNLAPDKETDFLGYALADAVIGKLAPIKSLNVRPASSIFKYRNQTPSPQQAAQELQADFLLTGSYLKEGETIKIKAELVDISKNTIVYQDAFDTNYSKLSEIQERIARRLIGSLGLGLTTNENLLTRDQPHNEKAYELYLRGMDNYLTGQFPSAIENLEKSVAADAQFYRAWNFLGVSYMMNASVRPGAGDQFEKAFAATEKSIALNPSDPRPRTLQANILTRTNRAEEAVPIMQKVIAENPENALGHWNLSFSYRFAGLIEKAVELGERAHVVDPGFALRTDTPAYYLYAGDYEKFKANLSPFDSPFVIFYRGYADFYLKNTAQAKKQFDQAYALDSGEMQTQIGKALSLHIENKPVEGLQILRQIESKFEQQKFFDAEGIYKLAQGYAVLGDKQSALRVFRKSVSGGFFCYPYFLTDPLMSNIRNEKEFQEILQIAKQRHDAFVKNFS